MRGRCGTANSNTAATHWRAPAITGVEQSGGSNDINWGTLDATGHIGIYVGDTGGLFSTNAVNNGFGRCAPTGVDADRSAISTNAAANRSP